MSDSVGKIKLEVEVQEDIAKQVGTVSNAIGQRLKSSLEAGTNAAFKGMKTNVDKGLNSVTKGIKSSVNTMTNSIKNGLSGAFTAAKNIKLPQVKFPKTEVSKPVVNNVSTQQTSRAPPVMDTEVLKAQVDNMTRTLDNTNNKIEQQREKLAQLKESYATTFNTSGKNKIQEQILKTEASINKLIGMSDKLGFKLNELDAKFTTMGTGAKKASSGMNNLRDKTKNFTNNAATGSDKTKKLSSTFKSLGENSKSTGKSINGMHSGLGMVARQFFTWMVILPIIMKGLSAMASGLLANLNTNAQFANSLAQIKTNLMVAFTPIFYAILPAINSLMSALSVATQYIASFISAIFGKTYQQSFQATQGLIDAKDAMGAYGDSAKDTAKKLGALAGFDEINQLNSDKGAGAGGSANSKVPKLVTPAIDTSSVDNSMKAIVDKIKAYFGTFDFSNLTKAFNRVKLAVSPIIDSIGSGLKWFFDNILDPLAHWTIEDVLPAFLNLLSGALDVLGPLIEGFMNSGGWLWDNFLQPIATWTGGVIVDVLNGLADILSDIGSWMSENQSVVDDFAIVLGSFAAAWGLVNIAMGIWNVVGSIAAGVTWAFGIAVEFLTSPIGIAIIAIGALIAIGVLLYKHWDDVKAICGEVWGWIQERFQAFDDWLTNIFATDWSKNFGFIGDILNAYLANVKNIWDSVKQIFGGIIDFVAGVFTGNWSRAWEGVKNIFGGVFNGLASMAKAPLNLVIGLMNGMFTGINWVIEKINSISIDLPFGGGHIGFDISTFDDIPYLARGGVINSPTLAMVGEAGKEAVVPLENNTGGLDLLAAKLMERIGGISQSSSNNNDRPLEIIVKVGETTLGRAAANGINKLSRSTGQCVIDI